jgi:hypothetical protein
MRYNRGERRDGPPTEHRRLRMSETEIVEFTEILPTAQLTGTRQTAIAPLAGRPVEQGYYVETVYLTRYDKIVILSTTNVGPIEGDVRHWIAEDTDRAEVIFANESDALRRDGWELAEVFVNDTAKAPF